MTTPTLLSGGSYQFDPAHPYELQFSDANDIRLPFQGTIIAPANTTTPEFGGMYRMMFLSLQYPTKIENGARTFPVLRDFENKPLAVTGPCLILAADDTTFLDNVHLGNLADDFSHTYDPIYKDNTVLSSVPRYLLIQFSNIATLPDNLNPISRDKDFQLRGNGEQDGDVKSLRNALNTAATLSGKILAFDLAGHQTEAYSSLLALGIIPALNNPAPADNQIRIQFVDIHGNPLAHNAFPLINLIPAPLLDGSQFNDHKFYSIPISDPAGKKAEFSLKLNTTGVPPDDPEAYRHYFHYAAVWPGYDTQFKRIGKDEATLLDFFKAIPENDPKPKFIRLALFHPADEFQTTAGGELEVRPVEYCATGEIEEQAVFRNNGFRLFTSRNHLKVFNTGEGYFSDYYDEVSKLQADDSLYQANWSGNAHLHLKGSMRTRLIQPSEAEPADVYKLLTFIRENALFVPLDPQPPDDDGHIKQDYLLVGRREEQGAQITTSFAVDVETQPDLGDPAASRVHRGFVRPNAIFAWKLKGDPDTFDANNLAIPEEHTAHAYWKNSMGLVKETTLSNVVSHAHLHLHQSAIRFPAGMIALDINGEDPPQAIIRRTQSAAVVRTRLGLTGSSVNPLLLVLNLSAGSSHKFPLIPAGSDDNSTDLVLGTLAEDAANGIPGMTGDDVLAIAVIEDRPPGDRDLAHALITSFKTFVYSNEAHLNAAVPRLPTESGGLLRQAIAKGVKVRALMWEHLLKRLSGGPDIAKGHGNNHQLVNLINRTVNGKRGYAFVDQATRELGAWHQKPTVMMREVAENLGDNPGTTSIEGIAYLGGMDMALGRWETEHYFTRDPDRQSMGQNDVQMKLTGDAAWDVLQNFRHRWKGIGVFLEDEHFVCHPVNTSEELKADAQQPFCIPDPTEHRIKYPPSSNAFIQVNRTMPPFTCFSQNIDGLIVPEEGELGSLASYKKGIERARKFIFINEQYFFSPEIAIAVREALLRPGGPEFAIIVLPLELDESKYVDPLFFKLRQKTLNILRYGYAPNPLSQNSCDERIALGPGSSMDISSRIAILSLVNADGKDIYTHSKHIIVDDVWMTAGSANMTNRGLTYEMEINAAVVGQKLYEGGTTVVREQRIELCRRLLGLPKAYTAALEDPYAAFRLFKAIEGQGNGYNLNVYPLKPLVKWLDTSYVKRVPEDAQFDAAVEVAMNMDVNSSSFNYFICNLLDADGRRHDPDRLGYLAHMLGMGKLLSYATANLGITFSGDAYSDIRGRLFTGGQVTLTINATVCAKKLDENGEPALDKQGNPIRIAHGPYLQHQYPLVYDSTNDVILLDGLPSNQLSVTLSTEHLVVFTATVTDKTAGQLPYTAQLAFDPDTSSIEYGQTYQGTIQLGG